MKIVRLEVQKQAYGRITRIIEDRISKKVEYASWHITPNRPPWMHAKLTIANHLYESQGSNEAS